MTQDPAKQDGLRVLLVEDNPGDTLYIQELLDQFSLGQFTIVCCTTLAEALQSFEHGAPDVVLLDLNLPDSSALETLDAVHGPHPGVPVIVLTGLKDNELGQEAIHRGAQDYLVKSEIEAPLLERSISYGLERQRIEDRLRSVNAELEERVRSRTAALASEKEHLSVILESIEDAVIETDAEGRVRFLNRRAQELLGLSETETHCGKALCDLFRDISRDADALCATILGNARSANEAYLHPSDLESTHPTEGRRVLRATGAPIRSQGADELHGLVVVLRDVTDERQREEDMQRAAKLESLGLLAGGISHDFNNILTVISGNVSTALALCKPSEDVADLLREVQAGCEQAASLTHQLLTFAKGGKPIKTATDAARLARQAAKFASRGSSVVCDYQFDADLWLAEVDSGQIGQVVSNLVINAVQAMPDGGTITVAAHNRQVEEGDSLPLDSGPYVVLQVRDTGCGIEPDVLARIFEPYFTTKERGSGLGLASAYSTVQQHGGHLAVQSEVGKGTVFTAYLPATRDSVQVSKERDGATLEGTARILFMDDEPGIRSLAKTVFNSTDYGVDTARDGEEAIALFRQAIEEGAPYDLVVLDLTVRGGLGGVQALKELRALDPSIKAVVSSGYSDDAAMANYTEFGFQAAVAKPWTVREFRSVVAHILEPNP